MTAKISNELLQLCRQTSQVNPQQEIPVIVTLNGPIDRAELEAGGLRINHIFEHIFAVAGTLRPSEVESLAQLEQVQLVEGDGEVSIASV